MQSGWQHRIPQQTIKVGLLDTDKVEFAGEAPEMQALDR